MGEIMQDKIARFLIKIERERERETLEELAIRVAEGETLADICKAWDVPMGRFAGWIAADARRQELYEGALRLRADFEVGEALRVADHEGGANTQHAALKVRVRQWAAAKWDRQRFGEAVQVQHSGETVVRLSFGAARQLVGEAVVVEEGGGDI